MVFAYLILAHKNPLQLYRLIKAIMDDNVFVFVHIDQKSYLDDFKEVLNSLDNVILSTKQKQVTWGGFSMIEATLLLIKTMYDSQIQPDFIHLISGQDFPIVDNATIFDFFNKHSKNNFIELHQMPIPEFEGDGGMRRILYKWFIEEEGISRAIKFVNLQEERGFIRSFLPGIIPYKGSQWWSLTGECVQWIYETCKPGQQVYDFYKYSFIPDEMFFQTLLVNSRWNETIINDNKRCIDWGKNDHDHPKIWKTDDFDRLVASGKLFARKFDESIDKKIIDQLEKFTKTK